MGKPRPRRVASDRCPVLVDGQLYYPHEGEWVELLAGVTVGQLGLLRQVQELPARLSQADGDADEAAQVVALMEAALSEASAFLAPRVLAWSWTDDLGRPLPQPDGTPGPLRALRAEELYWLLDGAQGETADDAGKGGSVSPTTCSATAPAPSRSGSSTARSRPRRS